MVQSGHSPAKQTAYTGILPEGYRTNMINEDRVESLSQTFSRYYKRATGGEEVVLSTESQNYTLADDYQRNGGLNWSDHPLGGTVDTISIEDEKFVLREHHVILNVIERVSQSLQTGSREIQLPGIDLNKPLMLATAIEFKQDTDAPSGRIKQNVLAMNDDIAFEFMTAESWYDVAGDGPANFNITADTDPIEPGDEVTRIGEDGLAEDQNATTDTLSLDDYEWLFVTGDMVEFAPGDDRAHVSAYQYSDVDGEGDYGVEQEVLTVNNTDVPFHTKLISAHLAKSSIQLDTKFENELPAGESTTEVPVAFRFVRGRNAAELTT